MGPVASADVVVTPFDTAESQRLLERRSAITAVLTEHDLDPDPAAVTAVLIAAEQGVAVEDEHGRPVAIRPAEPGDAAAILDSFGVVPPVEGAVDAAGHDLEMLLDPAGERA